MNIDFQHRYKASHWSLRPIDVNRADVGDAERTRCTFGTLGEAQRWLWQAFKNCAGCIDGEVVNAVTGLTVYNLQQHLLEVDARLRAEEERHEFDN